ncbi:NAD(P)/FAD-dependent oxidoreductase [Pseudodonghicola flavimaris]|uniref:FAD-binding oxidoreductase n=1 Tax=Pseudodonghicola flavimaris TaxID=3050036 RepID=A0ABT7F1T8_9RHOB|nr:FAD-binding oxidoreductase [Pseudodonghicola flavimaris]MDK3018563.1 FAD-binding oxidoreductase [Pseudodonghicola flavimaris]
MTYQSDCLARFPSYWMDTAEEEDLSSPLDGDATCDVAIIGAGYTGLACAVGLAEQGIDVRVLDGGFVGWGGSGRNSGSVIRGFKSSRSDLVRSFGTERGGAMAAFGDRTAAAVYGMIDRFGIACDLRRTGWLLPAHNAAGLRRTEERYRSWTADGTEGLELLDQAQVAGMLGSEAYVGGMIDRECGALHPLSYARGLARGAISLGAKVHGGSRVLSVARKDGHWELRGATGTVRADRVLIAANAYVDGLERRVERSIATIHTHMIATDPLPAELAATILPGRQTASDSRRILYYWHLERDNRLLFGTRGLLNGPRSDRDFDHVRKGLLSIYPQLAGIGISHRWAGRVGMTKDFLPHIDQPEPGLWAAYGYCGRGVAMATSYGMLLARAMVSNAGLSDIDMPRGPAPQLPGRALKSLGIVAATQFYRLLDLVD